MSEPTKKYSEEDQATALAALAANDGNLLRTARELGIPVSTLRKWRNGQGVHPNVSQKCDQKKEELADLFERVARIYLDRALEKAAVGATTGKDAIIAAATATDKLQLLRGKPTQIVSDTITVIEAVEPDEDSLLETDPAETAH